MAAVDRRMGPIRRGTTPTAPKPINLPSQKLENQGLVPDVDIVPRGTFCWGRAGRSSAASGKNNEITDSASLHLESNAIVDNGSIVQDDLDSLDEVQGSTEWSNPPHPVESSTSPTSSLARITPVETTTASSSSGSNDAKLDSSDAGSLPGSIAPTSSSESGTSPVATPVTFNKTWDSAAKVEEQKHSKGFPVVCCEGSEKVPNLESKEGIHGCNESLPGSQDFGYFEGFYSNHQAFFSPEMSCSNGPGMAFGPGLHPESSQHEGFYSFLGVPYYDSTKDKEIVVITMVGNPGFHGNYFPQPGFPDQYGRPTVCGNFPLQFGHFEHFAVPGQNVLDGRYHMSAEINPMCLGEQGEFLCYEQGYYKEGWLSGSSIGDLQRGNGAYLPTSFSMYKSSPTLRDYNVPKRARRQKSAYRNKRAAPKEASSTALKPERRVTLLTKVSQHEVIISSLQKRSKPVGNRQAVGFSGAPSLSENFMEASFCETQCETAIAESSNADRVHEIVDIKESHVPDVSTSMSAQEPMLQQATPTGSNNVDSALLSSRDISCLKSKAEISVSESSSTTISTLESQAHGEMVVCHQDTVATSCPGAACPVPAAPSTKTLKVIVKKARPKCEAKHVSFNVDGYSMNAAELPQDAHLNDSTDSAALTEQVNEHVNREETPSTTTVALLPHGHNQGLMLRWRRKGFVTVAKLGQEHSNSKAQEAVVDKKASSLSSPSDKTNAGADFLPDATVGTKAMSQCNGSLSSCVPAALSAGETSAASKEMLDASGLNCAVPDSISKVKKSKNVHKALSGNVDLDSVAESSSVQIRESSNKLAIKTLPFAEGQILNLKSASCGFGKEWRPKLPGAGYGKTATKVSSHQASKVATTINFSELHESEHCLTNIHGDPKHRLEVSCDDECVVKSKQQQQDEGRDTLSLVVDRPQTAKNISSTCTTGFDFKNLTEREQKVECNCSETFPLRYCRVEQRGNVGKPIGDQKLQQQEPLSSKPEESNYTCRGDMPMNYNSFEACSGHSSSSENHLGVDHKVSKVAKSNNFSSTTQGSQSVPSLQTQEKSKEMEDPLHPSQRSVSQPMLATQINKPKGLTREVNQSSKPAHGLRQQSSVKNYQEQKRLPVNNVPLRHAGPRHIMEKNQHSGSVARSLPNFGRDSRKQGLYVASWEGRKRGFPLDISRYERFDQNHGHPQEGQSMHRWQQPQKVWNSKVMCAQETQTAATTCNFVSKPCEGCCTFSEGKPAAENKQRISFVQGASGVSWKPKQISSVQVFKEKFEEGNDNPSSSASQKQRVQGEYLLIESSGNAPLSSACGNEQQLEKQVSRKLSSKMKEASEVCPVAGYSSAPSSPSGGSGQQVDNMGKQGFMKSASQSKKAFDELPAAILSSSCGNGHHISDIDKQESLKPGSPMKMEPEEHPIVTSSNCATLSTTLGNGQRTGNIGKQSYKAVLEMEYSAVNKKVTTSVEQAVFGPVSQPVSAVAISLKLEDTPLTRTVKSHRNYTSWRPKTVSENIAVKSTFSKEVNENDPSACTHVEGARKKHSNPLPASKFAASNDLHVWKNNGRHTVRASYGLPYRRKDYSQLQNSLGHQAKLHTDGASSLELPDRANDTCLDRESSRASKSLVAKEVKHASPMKQTKMSPSLEHPVSKLKFSQHHVYAVKQAHFTSNQHSPVGNRRPFSTNSNFAHDDNKKLFHYQQPLLHMCLPIEQGYRRPFSAKPNFSYDDNKRAVHHQQFLSRASKHTEQVKVRENSCAVGVGHVESLCPSRSDMKPARHGQLHNGRKFADSDKRGWVVKTETRCGDR